MLAEIILPLNLPWNPVYLVPEGMSLAVGSRVDVVCAGRHYCGVVAALDVKRELDEEKISSICGVEEDLPAVGEKEIKFWEFVSEYYMCPIGDVYKAAYPSVRLKGERVAAKKKEVVSNDTECTGSTFGLSRMQSEVLDQCLSAFKAGKPVLLQGVTGSGKTEIYLELASRVMKEGRKVLYLVPEIALGSQLEGRLKKVFPTMLHTYHSSLTPLRRRKVASAVRAEGACMVLGTRSSIYLPFDDLGLIIVDEEHDSSYKSDSSPRLNARDCAVMLSRIHSCHLVMGSATPSLESLYNASRGGYAHVILSERFFDSQDADVEIIDTIAERRKNGMLGSISRKLAAHISDTLQAHRQVLVFRSRRAYNTSVQCSECGEIVKCPHCNVPFALHKDGRLHCHYCGNVLPFETCSRCGGQLTATGSGTQKVEEELAEMFPDAVVARLDSDVSNVDEVVSAFGAGEIDILVGTQIVTKGFDFDSLSLVAVVGADGLLGQQDFRADERALQLLSQFRGRSGRRGEKGLFVIQTAQASHPVFAQLSSGESHLRLLEERRAFGYPPFTRIVNVIFRDHSEKRLSYMSSILSSDLINLSKGVIQVIGPFAPSVDKVADNHIRHIRIILARDQRLSSSKKTIMQAISSLEKRLKYSGHIFLDVDPL